MSSENDLISLLIKIKRGRYNQDDVRFMQKIYDDILQYMSASSTNVSLVFPPLDVCWRYMIHKFCEHKGLFGLTVGEGVRRMVLVIDMKRLELSAYQESTAIVLLKEKVLMRDGTKNPIFSQTAVTTNTSFNVEATEFCPKKAQSRKELFSSGVKLAEILPETPSDLENSSQISNSVSESKSEDNYPDLEDGAISIYNCNLSHDEMVVERPVEQPVDLSLYDYGCYYNMMVPNQYAMYSNNSLNLYYFPEHTCYNSAICTRCLQYAYRHQYY